MIAPVCCVLSNVCGHVQIFNTEPVLPVLSARPDQVEKALKTRYHDAMSKLQPQNKEIDLLIVILPDNNGSLYGS